MEYYLTKLPQALCLAILVIGALSFLFSKVAYSWWISPIQVYQKLRKNGFGGPTPNFPLGNITEMKREIMTVINGEEALSNNISHNIHSTVFPYFARWRKIYGKLHFHHAYIYI